MEMEMEMVTRGGEGRGRARVAASHGGGTVRKKGAASQQHIKRI
jgi:hypothetical protein